MKVFVRNIIITILAFVLVFSFALIAYQLPFLGPIAEAIKEFEMTDVYCQILQDTNDEEDVSDVVTIVDMSDLFSRRDIATALEKIEEQSPRVLCVDVVFEGLKEDSIGDEMITKVATNHQNVMFSYKLHDYENDSLGHTTTVHSFFAEEGLVIEGFTNMPRNLYGGIKRIFPMGEKVDGKLVSSFVAVAAEMYANEGKMADCQPSDKKVKINFIPKHYRVVEPDSIDRHPEWLKDKLVLFGAMRDENDMHYTPLGKMAGTELLGYAIETLLEKGEIKEVKGWVMAVISFLLVLLTQVVFSVYTHYAKKRKNRIMRFLMSATFMRSYLMFIWIAFWMWVAFILFYLYDIALDMGWALSAIAFLLLAQSIYDEFMDAIKTKKL